MGAWEPIISLLQGVLLACGGLGIVAGVAVKAVAGTDEGRHAASHKIMTAAGVGLMFGLLAPDIYALIFSWMGQ